MRLLWKATVVQTANPSAPPKPPVVEGWSERELATVYSAAYKIAVNTTSRINVFIRAVTGEVSAKNALMTQYFARERTALCEPIQSGFVQDFLRKMPRMPAYAMDLTVKLLDENASVQEIADGIKSDPSVAAIVLRAVNSPQYSFQKKIETFYHACMILGLNSIYDLILREAFHSAMPDSIDTRRIHQHSCLISALCYEIAAAAKDPQAQAATTLGLLHDMGKGVQILMKGAHADKADRIDAMPASKLGAELLLLWGLSERMCRIVECQDYPEFTPPEMIQPEYQRGTAVLHLAHVLERMLAGQAVEPERDIYTRDYMALLGLPEPALSELLKDCILPSQKKNRSRLPAQIRDMIPQ